MAWIGTTQRVPGGNDFYIGEILVAKFRFVSKQKNGIWSVQLIWAEGSIWASQICLGGMSEALKLLHKKLNSPPKEQDNGEEIEQKG